MATSYFLKIAEAVRTKLTGIDGAPTTIEIKDNDQVESRQEDEILVITMGEDPEVWTVTGAGTGNDFGDVGKAYQIGLSYYHKKLADPTVNLDAAPTFVLKSKQALNRPSLTGVPSVYDTTLVENPAWENQEFSKGLQVTRFGMIFLNAEPRNG